MYQIQAPIELNASSRLVSDKKRYAEHHIIVYSAFLIGITVYCKL